MNDNNLLLAMINLLILHSKLNSPTFIQRSNKFQLEYRLSH